MLGIAFGFLLGGIVPTWILMDYLKAKRKFNQFQTKLATVAQERGMGHEYYQLLAKGY